IRAKLLFDGPNHDSLATRLVALKNKYPNNLLLRVLSPEFNTTEAYGPHKIHYEGSALLDEYITTIEQEYLKMLASGNKDLQTFATDLIKYTFVASNTGRKSTLLNLLPAFALLSNKQTKGIRDVLSNINSNPDKFIKQAIQHNPHLAKKISKD